MTMQLAFRRIRIVAVGPFGAKFIITTLNQYLGIVPFLARVISSVDGSLNRRSLISIRSVMLLLEADLPLPLMKHDEILRSSQFHSSQSIYPEWLLMILIRARGPGVVYNFTGFQRTGGGRSAQDTPNITFSENEAAA